MTEVEYSRKLEELDRLLNDPDVPMEPAKVWSLLAELSGTELSGTELSGTGRITAEPSTAHSARG